MSVEPMSCNRRSFLKGSLVAASGLALGALAGCGNAPTKSQAATVSGNAAASADLPDSISMADIENSAVELEPVTDFAAEEIYDIVVVGAGCAGVPAVLTALEEGGQRMLPAEGARGLGQRSWRFLRGPQVFRPRARTRTRSTACSPTTACFWPHRFFRLTPKATAS